MSMTASALRSIKSGPVKPLFEKWRFLKMSRPELYGNSYLRNAWAEIPEVLFFSGYLVVGVGVLSYQLYQEWAHQDFSVRPYKHYYTVMRPDDERVKKIQREYYARKDGIYDFNKITLKDYNVD